MIKTELYLVKKNENFEDVYEREYVTNLGLNDYAFFKKAKELGYMLMAVKTEINYEAVGDNAELILTTSNIEHTIFSPDDILDGKLDIVQICPFIIDCPL